MSDTLARVQRLIRSGHVRVSAHGYDELASDHIFYGDVVASVETAVIVEDYPTFAMGPCVLVLQKDADGQPLHIVWGIPKDHDGPAVLVTAYRPDPARWSGDFAERKKT